MDLSFPRFDRDAELVQLPGELAALIVGVAARQAASATALAARPAAESLLFAPVHGAFNGPMARAIVRWRKE